MVDLQRWMRRAYEYSINRSIARFHWMSDVIYGRLFATMIVPILNAMIGLRDGYEAMKEQVKNAILDGEIENTFEAADAYMRERAAEIGMFPVN